MTSSKVAIIDYGMGNLLSVKRSFEYCGAEVLISDDPLKINEADRIVLPGVGAFKDGIDEIKKRHLKDVVLRLVEKGRPILGICLGMQMMYESSEENGFHQGLSLMKGSIVAIPAKIKEKDERLKVPHIGWSELSGDDRTWRDEPLLRNIMKGSSVYFVHSFMATLLKKENLIAHTIYGGHQITALVRRENVVGCQFHPEKSGEIGLKIIRNFITY
jgi:imidazole glycerol-phosphate synthase subunit HisH